MADIHFESTLPKTEHRKQFLMNEFLTLSILGALGRSNTYSRNAKDANKNQLRNALRQELGRMAHAYRNSVSEESHCSNIEQLSNDLSGQFGNVLRNQRFRIGIAQKALNLYLKYLWVSDFIKEPPHCPFDSIIIKYLPDCSKLKWTSVDTMSEYRRLVASARQKAEAVGKTLPEWELAIWTNSIQAQRHQDASTPVIKKSARESTVSNSALKSPPAEVMPKKGDIFFGKINDLGNFDTKGWRRRDIWFFKKQVNQEGKCEYPAPGRPMRLIDIDGNGYTLNFTKPDSEEKICLGKPGNLKPWYSMKGFNYEAVDIADKIYFEYTGEGIDSRILTEQEYTARHVR